MELSRRHAVLGAVALPLLSKPSGALAQGQPEPQTQEGLLPPTGQETFGPYYPVRGPRGHDLDLTHYPGRSERALGQVIELTGRVTDRRGIPLPDTAVTLWQANAAGRYVHPLDTFDAPIDPNFLGVVDFNTAPDGTYRLRTIKPGAYPEPSGTIRTPHIHFDLIHADYRLVTQMYFPGESLNATDILLSTLVSRRRNPATVICKPAQTSEPGVSAFNFDIVMLAWLEPAANVRNGVVTGWAASGQVGTQADCQLVDRWQPTRADCGTFERDRAVAPRAILA